MRKNSDHIENIFRKILTLSVSGCEGEFHVIPFVILYLYAYKKLEVIEINSLKDTRQDVIIYKYINNSPMRVLITDLDKNDQTENLIKVSVSRTLKRLSDKKSVDKISTPMFELYNLLKTYQPQNIRTYLENIYSSIITMFFSVTGISHRYYTKEQHSFSELSRLILRLLTKDNNNNYSILHPTAGPANFVEHLTENISYHALYKKEDVEFQCLYHLLSIITNKNTNLLCLDNAETVEKKVDAIIIDNVQLDMRTFWHSMVSTIKNGKTGVFLAEGDVLFEFKNSKWRSSLKEVDLLSYVSHVIFLPNGLVLIWVCSKKDTEDVILLDESHNQNINSDRILDDLNNQRHIIHLKKEEYLSYNFVFALNHILGKRNTKELKKGTTQIIPLKDILYPSKEVGTTFFTKELNTYDYNYSKFYPFYVAQYDSLINERHPETLDNYRRQVLILDLTTKLKYQPKVLCFNNFKNSISFDERAFNIRQNKIDINYLINEMNKKYFIDQIFPTNVKTFITFEWKHFKHCYIKLPLDTDTITPIERQKLALNADKMDFINQSLNSYDYDIQRILRSGTDELSVNTQLLNGKYTIIGSIKNGGFGKTYKAIKKNDDGTTTLVAIKEFFYNGLHKRDCDSNDVIYLANVNDDIVKVRKDFFNEASKIRTFANCPNIVRVIDVFDENNTSYYSMEYLDGENLYDYVTTKVGGRLCEKEALTIIRGIANALTEMHKVEMLHMDVKPNNVVVCKDGRIVLIDFGGSRNYKLSSDEGHTIAALNSPGYTPPEGLINRILAFKPTYDIYSLGATLNFMLTGDGDSENSQIINNKNRETSVNNLPDSVSSETQQCITKSLNYSPVNRPQSIEEFLALLPSI